MKSTKLNPKSNAPNSAKRPKKPVAKFQARKPSRPATTKKTEEREPTNGWLLQSPPGAAIILKKEMVAARMVERKAKLYIKRQRNHDLVFLNRVKNEAALGSLRIAEMILRCPLYGRYKISLRQLEIMASELKKLGARRLVVTAAGSHFNRQDLVRWLTKEMKARDYIFSPGAEEEVWMFCVDEEYYFGVPVKKAHETEGREERVAERKGSLPPEIAAALVFAGQPGDEDIIFDPTCGSGTLLAEAHAYAPKAKLFGIDIDSEAIGFARKNLAAITHQDATLLTLSQGDSRKLDTVKVICDKLSAESVTLTLSNLPFGVQFGARPDNPALYEAILREAVRMADRKRWRGIVLTSDATSLGKAVAKIDGLDCDEVFKVKVRGELAHTFKLTLRRTARPK